MTDRYGREVHGDMVDKSELQKKDLGGYLAGRQKAIFGGEGLKALWKWREDIFRSESQNENQHHQITQECVRNAKLMTSPRFTENDKF